MKEFSTYDQRKYPTVSVQEGYKEWSKTYDTDNTPIWMTTRLASKIDFISWSQLERVVELSCGTGRFGEWLKSIGVRNIDGVDFSPEMLERAEARNIYTKLLTEDVRKTSLESQTYDVVFNVLSDEHLPDLAPLYQEVGRICKTGGYFIMLGCHPFFLMSGVSAHYDKESGDSVAIQTYVHPFSDHVTAALSCGFELKMMDEAFVSKEWAEQLPSMAKHLGKALSYMMVWQKN